VNGAKSSKRRKSLESELKAMELDHDNIVRVYGVHAADDRHAVIIMEYVGSRNLHRLLVELREKTLGSSWLLLAAKQVSSALAHCHSKGILHMDVKPANIMVTSQGLCKLGFWMFCLDQYFFLSSRSQPSWNAWLPST